MNLKKIPKYIINLDLPPEKRWINLIKMYRTDILKVYIEMEKIINSLYGNFIGSIGFWMIQKTINMFGDNPLYYYELKSIADELNIPVNKIILLQLCYECFSACTSIILDDDTKLKYPIHIRTMDWDDTFLRPLTANIKFIKNKKLVFEGTTWIGYVGILTGVKPNIGSVSINYRRTKNGSIWTNICNTIQFKFPIGYLVRECLTNCTSYENFKHCLETTDIIAPCYIIITGTESKSGAVIIRDTSTYKTYKLNDKKTHICQTNIDPIDLSVDGNINILWSVEKHSKALSLCESLLASLPELSQCNNIIDPEKIIKYFLKHAILNNDSIYANVMSPVGPNNTYLNAGWTVEH
jgi:hypothetical protein